MCHFLTDPPGMTALDDLELAQGGVLSRAQLRAFGIDADRVRNQVTARRWRIHGRRTVARHTGPLDDLARRWMAVWEVGERIAVVDGVTSLQHAGLVGYVDDRPHVSVNHRVRLTAPHETITVHKVRARHETHVLRNGLPRTRPEIAAVRAAHWAVSDRQAALVLAMTVQQRLVRPDRLQAAVRDARGRTRRAFVAQVVRDVTDGAHSLGELDLGAMCRRRGLPAPDHQVVRQTPRGRIYLDAGWRRHRVSLEIDGAQHRQGLQVGWDSLRQNEIVLGGDRVLRIDLLGLRVLGDQLLDQLARALGRA